MYNIKAVAVLDKDKVKGKFKDFMAETNSGNTFRVYKSFDKAEHWLLTNQQ
jgi:PadR family transcriptional regulator AphA